jgi:hypothetical protein
MPTWLLAGPEETGSAQQDRHRRGHPASAGGVQIRREISQMGNGPAEAADPQAQESDENPPWRLMVWVWHVVLHRKVQIGFRALQAQTWMRMRTVLPLRGHCLCMRQFK